MMRSFRPWGAVVFAMVGKERNKKRDKRESKEDIEHVLRSSFLFGLISSAVRDWCVE